MLTRKSAPRFAALVAGSLCLAPLACTKVDQAPGAEKVSSDASGWTLGAKPAFAQTAKADTSIADIAEAVTPSVVTISATQVSEVPQGPQFQDPLFRHFFGPQQEGPSQRRAQGLGSGVIVDASGLVLTNHHVIDHAADIKVETADNRTFAAEVVGSDDKSDLAVLRLQGKPAGLKPVKLGDSSELRLGEVVLAVGNPFGVGQTVTMGIVSAKGRSNMGIEDYEDFIQTDAAINPGNSGGALVNMRGQLVGINTAILSRSGGYQGIGFAIPSNMAKPIMDSLLKNGKVDRGWLGIGIQDINHELAAGLNLKDTKGVLVSDVQSGSPAEKGGIQRGDVILSIDGKATDSTGQLRNLVAAAGSNKDVKVEIFRSGDKKSLSVHLGALPEKVATFSKGSPQGSLSGLTLQGLDDASRSRFNVPSEVKNGVVVIGVDGNSPAAETLRVGDVILEVNRQRVQNPDDFKQAFSRSSKTVLLLVYRAGSTIFMTLPK